MSTFDQYTSRALNDPNNETVTTSSIDRLALEGENDFCVDYPCILKRISLATTSGINSYRLPDDVISIRRVTWKGFKCDPLPHRNAREIFQNMSQQGRPFWYIFNNVTQNTLQLFPTPTESLTSTVSNLYGNEIPNRFIVEYFQAPDFNTATLPTYFRRRILKSYVLRVAPGMEGRGKNLRNSAYYKKQYDNLKMLYGGLLGDLHNKPRKLVVTGIGSSYFFPGVPILPIDRFGTSVDTGE